MDIPRNIEKVPHVAEMMAEGTSIFRVTLEDASIDWMPGWIILEK